MTVPMFRRAVKFAEGVSADQAENRLTEITAAVLERDLPFARGFIAALLEHADREARPAAQPRIDAARAWLGEHGETAEVLVATQLMRGGRFVDLEVRLAPDPLRRARDLVVWVEVKHGADVSRDQLHAYLDLIEREPGVVHTLIVLAPRDSPLSEALVPPAVPVTFWQRVLGDTQARLPPRPQGSASALLTQELLTYFKEEGLMPIQPMTTELALSLAARDEARETVRALRDIVRERVGNRYEEGEAKGSSSKSFWTTYAITPTSPAWEGAWLEWGFRADSERPGARGVHAFFAGVTFPRSTNVAGDLRHKEWLIARLDQGLDLEQVMADRYPRLWSYHYPEQLLIASTFEEQAALLASWVLARFDALAANPPT